MKRPAQKHSWIGPAVAFGLVGAGLLALWIADAHGSTSGGGSGSGGSGGTGGKRYPGPPKTLVLTLSDSGKRVSIRTGDTIQWQVPNAAAGATWNPSWMPADPLKPVAGGVIGANVGACRFGVFEIDNKSAKVLRAIEVGVVVDDTQPPKVGN